MLELTNNLGQVYHLFLTVAKELPEQVKQVKMCSNLEREKGEMWKIWLKQVSIGKKTNFKGNTIKWVLL